MDKEKKMFLFDLSSLKTDNVAEVYTQKFLLCRYENSDTVMLDGKPIEPGIERYLMRLPNEDGASNLKGEGIISDTKDGLPLKEIHFIEQEIRKYKPLFEKSIGSKLNQTQHTKLEIYLDYLYSREKQLKPKTTIPMAGRNFADWLDTPINWSEVVYQHNTGRGFTHKQDLVAVFANSYTIEIKSRIKDYITKFNGLPKTTLRKEIINFRRHFPKTGRVEGVNYYDDLIELLLEEYETLPNAEQIFEAQAKNIEPQYINNESTIETLRPTLPIKTFKLKEGVTDATVKEYHDALINNKSIDCSIEEFKTVFSDEDQLPADWKPIRWLKVSEKKNFGTPHRSGLAAIILKLLDVKKSVPSINTMSLFFIDKNGKSIKPTLRLSKSNLEKELPYIK